MSIGNRLSGAMKGGASKRLLVLGIGVLVIGGAVFFLSPTQDNVNPSVVRASPPSAPTVQGRTSVTPAMSEELSQADQQRADRALETGGSAIPTIRVGDSSSLELDLNPSRNDELVLPERPTPPSIELPIISPPVNNVVARPLATPVREQAQVNPHTAGFAGAMQALQPQTYPSAQVQYHYDASTAPAQTAAAAPSFPSRSSGLQGQGTFSANQGPDAGSIVYARMITEANSDAPGPILAEILQGEYAGARVMGRFSSTRDKLVLQFTSMSFQRDFFGEKRTETIPIDAVAVDSKNIGAGVATSVDYHLLENVGVTLAASFAQGFGRAVAQTGSSVVSSNAGLVISNPGLTAEEQLYVAGGEAAAAAGQSFNQLFGNRAPTVKVASGTPVGIFFLTEGITR